MRIVRIFLVFLCVALLIAPLLGLLHLILYPPPDPWGVAQTSLLQKLQNSNIIRLSINSLLLSIAVAGTATLLGGFLA